MLCMEIDMERTASFFLPRIHSLRDVCVISSWLREGGWNQTSWLSGRRCRGICQSSAGEPRGIRGHNAVGHIESRCVIVIDSCSKDGEKSRAPSYTTKYEAVWSAKHLGILCQTIDCAIQ